MLHQWNNSAWSYFIIYMYQLLGGHHQNNSAWSYFIIYTYQLLGGHHQNNSAWSYFIIYMFQLLGGHHQNNSAWSYFIIYMYQLLGGHHQNKIQEGGTGWIILDLISRILLESFFSLNSKLPGKFYPNPSHLQGLHHDLFCSNQSTSLLLLTGRHEVVYLQGIYLLNNH